MNGWVSVNLDQFSNLLKYFHPLGDVALDLKGIVENAGVDCNPSVWIFFQVPWAQRAGCATSPPGAQMAARSCVVGGATTPCASNASPSVSASSSGAALWSAATARTSWMFTPASPTSEPIGWT